MKYIVLAVLSLVFIIAAYILTARKIARELVIPEKKERGFSNPQYPHEKKFTIASPDGYNLTCVFLPVGDGTSIYANVAILVHGFGSCKEDMYPYAEIFTSLGYSVLIPDMRAHGESGGTASTMGYREQHDLSAIIRWLKDCYGHGVSYGLFGVADGGTAALLCAKNNPDVKFVITDSAISNVHELYKHIFKAHYKIKTFPMLNIAELFIKAIAGFKPKRVNTDSVFASETFTKDIPLFLIHGDSDKKVPPQMSVDIYNSKEYGLKTLYLSPDSGHREGFEVNREDYIKKIQTFLTENTED